jgi:hypothetical protein
LADARERAATFLDEVGSKPGQPEAGVARRVASITSLLPENSSRPQIISSGRWRYSIPSATPIRLFVSGTIPPRGHGLSGADIVAARRSLSRASIGRSREDPNGGAHAYRIHHPRAFAWAVFALMRGDFASAAKDGVAVAGWARRIRTNAPRKTHHPPAIRDVRFTSISLKNPLLKRSATQQCRSLGLAHVETIPGQDSAQPAFRRLVAFRERARTNGASVHVAEFRPRQPYRICPACVALQSLQADPRRLAISVATDTILTLEPSPE